MVMLVLSFVKLFPGFGDTYATTTDGRGSPIPRTGSPHRIYRSTETGMAAEAETGRSRSQSPVRTILASDVDPDQIQSALRQHSQRVMQLERERVCIAASLFI